MNEKNNTQRVLLNAPQITQNTQTHKLALITLLICYVCSICMKPLQMNWFDTLLLTIFLITCIVYTRSQYPLTKRHYRLILFMFACLIPNACFDNYLLKTINVLFIFLLLAYVMQSATHKLISKTHDSYMLLDVVNSVVMIPITAYHRSMRAILSNIQLHHIKGILLGIVITIPLLFIILPLLTSADVAFQNFIYQLINNMDVLRSQLLYICVSLLMFCYFYPFLYGHVFEEKNNLQMIKEDALCKKLNRISIVPSSVFMTLQYILMIVYAVFLYFTCSEILQNMSQSFDVFSYAQFARSGFFELCIIACINFGLIVSIHLLSIQKQSKSYRFTKCLLCIETILIILSAVFKMYLYIHMYGLTPLRIYSTWFMLLLLGIFVLIMYHTNHKQQLLMKHIITYFCICFFVLNMLDINTRISNYNKTMPIESQQITTLYDERGN